MLVVFLRGVGVGLTMFLKKRHFHFHFFSQLLLENLYVLIKFGHGQKIHNGGPCLFSETEKVLLVELGFPVIEHSIAPNLCYVFHYEMANFNYLGHKSDHHHLCIIIMIVINSSSLIIMIITTRDEEQGIDVVVSLSGRSSITIITGQIINLNHHNQS